MRISDWSSDVCSSDRPRRGQHAVQVGGRDRAAVRKRGQPPAQVLQFAHVAGPVVVPQALERGLAEALGLRDRKSVVYGKCVIVRVDLDGRRLYKKITHITYQSSTHRNVHQVL